MPGKRKRRRGRIRDVGGCRKSPVQHCCGQRWFSHRSVTSDRLASWRARLETVLRGVGCKWGFSMAPVALFPMTRRMCTEHEETSLQRQVAAMDKQIERWSVNSKDWRKTKSELQKESRN
jgi:hypothetical protein